MKSVNRSKSSSISRRGWAFISLSSFILTLLVTLLFIMLREKWDNYGLSDSVYYIILIPVGISVAALLSGAMRSYAKYKFNGESPYGTLELAGPVVIFFLVVIGGYALPKYLVNEKVFDLKIRLQSTERRSIDFNEGTITIYLDRLKYTQNIHEGEVEFYQMPSRLRGSSIQIVPAVNRYKLKGTESFIIPTTDKSVLEVELERTTASTHTEVRGTIFDQEGNRVRKAKVNFSSGLAMAETNNDGDFNLIVPREEGERLSVIIMVDDKIRFNNIITLSSLSPLSLRIDTR